MNKNYCAQVIFLCGVHLKWSVNFSHKKQKYKNHITRIDVRFDRFENRSQRTSHSFECDFFICCIIRFVVKCTFSGRKTFDYVVFRQNMSMECPRIARCTVDTFYRADISKVHSARQSLERNTLIQVIGIYFNKPPRS